MGFLKRFFSLGSKKSKRDRQQTRHANQLDPSGRFIQLGDSVDGEATRLLRSASAHFAEPSKFDSSLAPPLPQPSSSLLPTPEPSPVPSANSMQRRGTYTVKVHERRTEACTEFPNANPRLPDESDPQLESPLRAKSTRRQDPVTPREQSRLTRLKQDPSVVSLLNVYDDHGGILSTAFSNTPRSLGPINNHDIGGRAQTKRSGSTLRELLGESERDPGEETEEGDISWAERFLGEHVGSTTSLPLTPQLEIPKDILFPDDPPRTHKPSIPNSTAFSNHSHDYPTSSLEVNLSSVTVSEADSRKEHQETLWHPAEIFVFLSGRRRSTLERQRSHSQAGRPISPLESSSSSSSSSSSASNPVSKPSDNSINTHPRKQSHSRLPRRSGGSSSVPPNSDTSDTSIRTTATDVQIQEARATKLTPAVNPLSKSTDGVNVISSRQPSTSIGLQSSSLVSSGPGMRVQRRSTEDYQPSVSTSKIPRGPRPSPSWSNITDEQPFAGFNQEGTVMATSSNSSDLQAPQRTVSRTKNPKLIPANTNGAAPVRKQHRRIPSHTSSITSNEEVHISLLAPTPVPTPARPSTYTSSGAKKSRKADREKAHRDKENSPPFSSSIAPILPNSSPMPLRTIFDVRHPGYVNGEPPSPASSSELSPYTKEMMLLLRRQRMKAREEMGLNGKYNGTPGSQGKSARRRAERMLP